MASARAHRGCLHSPLLRAFNEIRSLYDRNESLNRVNPLFISHSRNFSNKNKNSIYGLVVGV